MRKKQVADHGTQRKRGKQHPVFDLPFWETKFPLDPAWRPGQSIESPGSLARWEQTMRYVRTKGTLGPSVPCDLFVWQHSRNAEKPWLTRIGGTPWRPERKPWPKGEDGVPLVFLGQICFVDSRDILPRKLPGDVVLFFGTYTAGWAVPEMVEWSPLAIKEPATGLNTPWTGELPFEYHGVIHRTRQYTDPDAAMPAFTAAGLQDSAWLLHAVQATLIGAYASLPQGWILPEEEQLICVLSSFSWQHQWPLCDVPRGLSCVRADGSEFESTLHKSGFGLGDGGATWVYRSSRGTFETGKAAS